MSGAQLTTTRPEHLARHVAWLIGTTAAVLLAVAPAAVIAGQLPQADTRVPFLSTFDAAWTLIAGAAAVLLGRLTFGTSTDRAWLIVSAGAVAAAISNAGLVTWTEARFGRFETEYVGTAWLLPLVVGLLAVVLASMTAATSLSRLVAAGVAGLCLLWLTVVGFAHVVGAGQSVGEVSWGLVIAFAAAGAFVAFALAVLALPRLLGRTQWT